VSAEEARRRLAAAQADVVAALVAGADAPEGFDRERLGVQARSLVAKRRAIVARMRPDAAMAVGGDLAKEFAAYARARTSPPPGYHADADDFAAWLRDRGRMPDPTHVPDPSRVPEPESAGKPRRGWWSRLGRR
uniref:hypothetical protein n=1 Tax=Nonomuraea rhizosphaerae TaxID=2665663 RepID=UPI001C5DEE47